MEKVKNESCVKGSGVFLLLDLLPVDTIICQGHKLFFLLKLEMSGFIDRLTWFSEAPWARSQSWFGNCCFYGNSGYSLSILVQLFYHGIPWVICCWSLEQEWEMALMAPMEVGRTAVGIWGKEASAKLFCRKSTGNIHCFSRSRTKKLYK